MGRHHFPEPRPTAPVPPRRQHAAAAKAPAGRPRRRVAGKVVTVAIGSALAVGFIPAAAPVAPVAEAPYATEAGSMSAWAHQKNQNHAQRLEPVGRAGRAARDAATTSAAPTTAASTTTPSTSSGSTSSSSSASAAPATTSAATTSTGTSSGLLSAGTGAVGGAMTTASELAGLPTSGAGWTNLLAAANKRSGTVDLANQDSTHAAETLASALVFARTGDTAQRDHVVSVLQKLPSASLSGARVLAIARQLGGYALAADLIGYRDAAFSSWIAGMRTKDVGNHGRWTTINYTSEDSANNWGTWAMATRIAISAYLKDSADLARAAQVFRGFTGEASAYAGFRKTNDFDPSWACGAAWVPINPASCGDKGGAIVEDISRSEGSYPSVDETGLTYSWEVLGGATLSARILERNGFRDVWQWGDRALLRAASFLEAHGGYAPRFRVNQYIPHEINKAYGVNIGPVGACGYGRQFGFSDWLG